MRRLIRGVAKVLSNRLRGFLGVLLVLTFGIGERPGQLSNFFVVSSSCCCDNM